MIRVLCIVGSMNQGGAETFLMKLFRKIDRTKYQMDFAVATEEKAVYDDEIESLGGVIYHISPKSKGIFKNFAEIKKVVKENEYRVVLRTSQNSLSALELFAAKLGGAKIRIFRSSNSQANLNSKKESIIHRICGFMPKLFANVRIAPSTEAAEFMFGKKCIQRGKAELLNNGIDTELFQFNPTKREHIRKQLNIENKFVLGHVGRFNIQKNHAFLMDVFSEVRKKNNNAVLLLVGVGELLNDIKQKAESLGIQESVIFLGNRSDIPDILSAMDLFVFPSFFEGMPNAVIEAQANGLFCVVSNLITKEAAISDSIQYLPIDNNIWIESISSKISRADWQHLYGTIPKEYSIEQVARQFEKIISR